MSKFSYPATFAAEYAKSPTEILSMFEKNKSILVPKLIERDDLKLDEISSIRKYGHKTINNTTGKIVKNCIRFEISMNDGSKKMIRIGLPFEIN